MCMIYSFNGLYKALSADASARHKELLAALGAIQAELKTIMLDLTALTQAVAEEKTVEQSAITLLTGLTTEIQTLIANSTNTVDPAALQAIVDGIKAQTTTLASAVTANAPVAPPAPPAPAPAA